MIVEAGQGLFITYYLMFSPHVKHPIIKKKKENETNSTVIEC